MCPVGLVVVTSGVGRKGLAAAVAENGTAAHGFWNGFFGTAAHGFE